MEEVFATLVEEVRLKRKTLNKFIIFCRKYDDCSSICLYFKSRLGRQITEPMGSPDHPSYHLVNMFTACTVKEVKDFILLSFSHSSTKLRIVVAAMAFGMGLDCPNVRHIIHWGPPSDVGAYIQETGRAG